MSAIEEYKTQKKALDYALKALSDPAGEEIKQKINQFLHKYDGVVESVFWYQYDEQTFNTFELYVTLVDDKVAHLVPDGSVIYSQKIISFYEKHTELSPTQQESYVKAVKQITKYPDLDNDYRELTDWFDGIPSEIFGYVYGYHVKVIFTKDNLKITAV